MRIRNRLFERQRPAARARQVCGSASRASGSQDVAESVPIGVLDSVHIGEEFLGIVDVW